MPLARVHVVGGSASLDGAPIGDKRHLPLGVPAVSPWYTYNPKLITSTEVYLGSPGGWSSGRYRSLGPGTMLIDIHIGCGTNATAQDGPMYVHLPPGYASEMPPGAPERGRGSLHGLLQLYDALGVATFPAQFPLIGVTGMGGADPDGEWIELRVAVQGLTQDINIDTYSVTAAVGPLAVPRMGAGFPLVHPGTRFHLTGTLPVAESTTYMDTNLPTQPPAVAKEQP
jgi:hypothetical protein